ncbi:MAG: hypothetical protein ACJAWF_002941 [Candidatus Azotimanducaceae bacterium]|jgi:hypothetical protein
MKTVLASTFWIVATVVAVLESTILSTVKQSGSYFSLGQTVVLVLMLLWFSEDAKSRGVEPSKNLKLSVLLVSLIAIPYYKAVNFGYLAAIRFSVLCIVLFGLSTFIVILAGL